VSDDGALVGAAEGVRLQRRGRLILFCPTSPTFSFIVLSHISCQSTPLIDRVPAALLAHRGGQIIIAGKRDPAMQRISDALGAGLTWFVQGRTGLQNGAELVDKFRTRLPQLTRDRRHAHRQKLAGKPRYRLIVFANRPQSEILFWLLTDQAEHASEKWVDSSRDKLTFYQWEAVRHTREGASKPAWTWAMSTDKFANLKREIVDAIRRGPAERAAALGRESRTWPGFARVRAQREQLRRVYEWEWQRKRSDPAPPWPGQRFLQRVRTQ